MFESRAALGFTSLPSLVEKGREDEEWKIHGGHTDRRAR
jgi:hypothetical protein